MCTQIWSRSKGWATWFLIILAWKLLIRAWKRFCSHCKIMVINPTVSVPMWENSAFLSVSYGCVLVWKKYLLMRVIGISFGDKRFGIGESLIWTLIGSMWREFSGRFWCLCLGDYWRLLRGTEYEFWGAGGWERGVKSSLRFSCIRIGFFFRFL